MQLMRQRFPVIRFLILIPAAVPSADVRSISLVVQSLKMFSLVMATIPLSVITQTMPFLVDAAMTHCQAAAVRTVCSIGVPSAISPLIFSI